MRFHMCLSRALSPIIIATLVVTASPATALAQRPTGPTPIRNSVARLAAAERTDERIVVERATQSSVRSHKSAIGWGIAAGIVAGAAVTAYGAQRSGENETGQFCTSCFVQWGAIAVPAGAGVGALVGLLIDSARR